MPIFIEHIPSGLPSWVLAGLALLIILLAFWFGALPTLIFSAVVLVGLLLVNLLLKWFGNHANR